MSRARTGRNKSKRYNKVMIKIEKKNKWAIDLSFHIPIPSFSIAITGVESEEIKNAEFSRNSKVDFISDESEMDARQTAKSSETEKGNLNESAGK